MKTIQLSVALAGIILVGSITAAKVIGAEPPSVVSAVAPVYPPIARSAGITGAGFVDVEIDADGKVTSADAVRAHTLLKEAVLVAARRWRFVPAPQGQRRRMARLTFSFIMLPERAPVSESAPVFYPQSYKIEVRSITHKVTTASH